LGSARNCADTDFAFSPPLAGGKVATAQTSSDLPASFTRLFCLNAKTVPTSKGGTEIWRELPLLPQYFQLRDEAAPFHHPRLPAKANARIVRTPGKPKNDTQDTKPLKRADPERRQD